MLTDHIRSSRHLFSILLLSIAVFVFHHNALAQTFNRTNYPILGNNHIVADLNGDGIPDLAAAGAGGVGVMLGNGDGTFRPRVNYSSGAQSQDLAAGDFNSDGRVDLVVSLADAEFSLAFLAGNGNGTFNAPVMFENTAAQDDSPAIIATDLDNDGRLDVVLAHALSCFVSPCVIARNITVMLGFGDGTFQTPFELDVGTGMSRIAVGDFNSDGIKDLGVAGDRAQVHVLLGIGNGSFLKQPTINLLASGTIGVDGTDIDVADLNGDAIQDLVVAIALNGSRTAILLGNNDGTFQPARIFTEPRLRVPQYQVIADFNRDGLLDLAMALANGTEGLLEIRLGNGDGTFRSPLLYLAPPSNSSVGAGTIVTGDFNRDGRPDIALPIIGANPSLAGLVNSTGGAVPTPTPRPSPTPTPTPTPRPTPTPTPTPPPRVDTVRISRAEYDSGKRVLRVEATSTNSSATLRVFVSSTGQLIGTLSNRSGQYRGELSVSPNPRNITVRSSLGGVATANVSGR